MDTPFLATGTTTGPSSSATNYTSPLSNSGWATTESFYRTPMGAGTISNFRVRVGTTISSGSYAFTLRKGANGGAMASQSTTVTCDSSNQTAVDSVNSFSTAEGDEVTLMCVPTGTPTAQTVIYFSFVFTSASSGESWVVAGANSIATTAGYFTLGGVSNNVTSEAQQQTPIPTGGSFTKLFVYLSAAPGSGNSRTFTIRKNGVDTGLTVTISDTATSGSVTSTVSFAAGDLVTIGHTLTGTPTTSFARVGLKWVPTVDGESLLATIWNGAVSNTSTIYGAPCGRSVQTETTESNTYGISPCAFTWRKLRAVLSAAPSSGKSRTFTARLGGASQSLSAAVADANTTANDNSNSVSVAANDLIDVTAIPSGTPNTAFAGVMTVAYIAPAAGGGTSGNLLLLGVG